MNFLAKHPYWTLIALSILAGIVLVRLYGWISAQEKIARVKRDIFRNLLEAVIFRHDVRLSLAAQGRMLVGGGKYFGLAAPPLVILLVPCVLLLGQLNALVGYQPAAPGEALTVSLKIRDAAADLFGISLDVPGAEVSPPLRIPSEQRVMWRIVPSEEGPKPVTLRLADIDAVLSAGLQVGTRSERFVNYASSAWLDRILYPSSIDLPPAVQEFQISYDEAEYSFLGLRLHWIIVFAIVSLVAGLVGGKLMHIEL